MPREGPEEGDLDVGVLLPEPLRNAALPDWDKLLAVVLPDWDKLRGEELPDQEPDPGNGQFCGSSAERAAERNTCLLVKGTLSARAAATEFTNSSLVLL